MTKLQKLLLLGVIALMFLPLNVSASLIIQDQIVNGSPAGWNFGQSFTAEDPNVSTISFWLSDGSATPWDPAMQFTFNLYSGAGYSGTNLFTTSVSVLPGYLPTIGDWIDVSLAGHSPLTVGDVYTFALYSVSNSGVIKSFGGGDLYSGGERYHDLDEDGTATVMSGDLAFRVVPSAAVPEPASLLLLGTGLAGLVGISRKRAK